MSVTVRQTYQWVYGCIQSLRREVPPKYPKTISIIGVVLGYWTIRNLFWKILNRIHSYPTGPLGLPFFGCFFPFALSQKLFIIKSAQKYGSVTYYPLLMSKHLLINDPKIVKFLYQTKKVISRPQMTPRHTLGFIFVNGDEWTKRRKLFSQTALTLSNSSFVLNNVRRSMDCVIPRMERRIQRNELWVPSDDVEYFAINNAWTAIFDDILSIDDPFVSPFCEMQERKVATLKMAALIDILSNFSGWTFLQKHLTWKVQEEGDEMLAEWMRKNGFEVDRKQQIMKRVNIEETGRRTKVYVDFLIEKLERGEIEYETIWGEFALAFAAAIDTTSQSGSFGLLLLAKHPNVQQKVYDELGMYIGTYVPFQLVECN